VGIVLSILLFITLGQAQELSSQQAQQTWSPKFGVSFKPLGAALGVELITRDQEHQYKASLVYNSVLNSHLGVQAVLRYDHEAEDPTDKQNLNWGLQLGSWEHNPHLQDTTETALGIQGDAVASFKLDQEQLRFKTQLSVVHVQSYSAFQVDARASVAVFQETIDPWGYRRQGHNLGVSSLWGATSAGGVFAVWTDAWYTQPLNFTGQDVIEISLRAGYKPEEVVPPLRFKGWAALLSAGYRTSIPVVLNVANIVSLQRLTLGPKIRAYTDGSLGLAADLALAADVLINDKPSSFALNIGYAEQAVWFKVGLLSPF
jgi:hypothetical protein